MTARRSRRSRRTTREVLWFVTAIAAVAVLAVADDLIRHGFLVLVAVATGAAGYLIGRRTGRGGADKAARRSLEASQRDRLTAELEQLSGRSLDEITASYRRIQGNYRAGGGPAGRARPRA